MVLSADNRFPLNFYYRIANQIIKQAKIYSDEGNSDDLYQTLMRYTRLVSEIIPQHRDYMTYSSKEKIHHRKILQECVKELEKLKIIGQSASPPKQNDGGPQLTSQRWIWEDQTLLNRNEGKASCHIIMETKGLRDVNSACDTVVNESSPHVPFQASSPVVLTASQDHGIDVHLVHHHFPSPVLSCVESLPLVGKVSHINTPESTNEQLKSRSEGSSSNSIKDVHISARLMEEFMELARANTEKDIETCGILGAFLTNQTFYVTTLIIPKQEATSNSCQALSEEEIYNIQDKQSLFPVGWIHVKTGVIESRGDLSYKLKPVVLLSLSDGGQLAEATKRAPIKDKLYSTHPSQTCFLSSVDLHTQYSYQIMLPEAIAIVMAPTDPARSYGIFRLTDPGGIAILKECRESEGFHPHPVTTPDGQPIYESSPNVYINPNLRFEVIDLRSAPSR